MAFDDQLVEVVRLGVVEVAEPEVVDDQKLQADQRPELLLVAVIEARRLEPLEHLI